MVCADRRPVRRRAFTLIELIVVIVILAILAGVATPKYLRMRHRAMESAELGVVGAVRAGIGNTFLNTVLDGSTERPPSLDSAAAYSTANNANPFFDVVLEISVIEGWTKGDDRNTYISPLGNKYIYVPSRGSLLDQSDYTEWLYGRSSIRWTATTITGLSPAEVAAIRPVELSKMSESAISAFSERQIIVLSNTQLSRVAGQLSREQVTWLSPSQMALLDADTVSSMHVEVLTADQVGALSEEAWKRVRTRLRAEQELMRDR